jgi:hypothetical protein
VRPRIVTHSVRGPSLVLFACAVLVAFVAPVAAHDPRQVGDYEFIVGFIGEPVFTGQRSGLDLVVKRGDTPIEGLEKTLTAQVIHGDARMDLPLSPRDGQAGAYESVFYPTAAGPYTFHIGGTVEGVAIDESFTSSAQGFSEVEEATAGQFPIQVPAPADLAADAKAGRDAAAVMPLALGLGAAGALLGLLALGVALAGRRHGAG